MRAFYQIARFIVINIFAPIALWIILTLLPLITIALLFYLDETTKYTMAAGLFIGVCFAPSAVISLPISLYIVLHFKGVFKNTPLTS